MGGAIGQANCNGWNAIFGMESNMFSCGFQTGCFHIFDVFDTIPFQPLYSIPVIMMSRPPLSGLHCYVVLHLLPVWLYDLLSVAHGSVPVLHVQTDSHGLVHHVKHVHVSVCKYRAHLLLAQLADLQQVTRGCCRVKDSTQHSLTKASLKKTKKQDPQIQMLTWKPSSTALFFVSFPSNSP